MRSLGLPQRLLALDTAAVSDALDRLDIGNQVAAGLVAVSTPRRIAGPAITVRLEAAGGRRADRHLGTAAVDAAAPGDVIVVAHPGPADVSGWGGLLSLGAKLRGVAAVVVDGACRDADQMLELDLPVYARGTTPRTARNRLIETAWNVPVTIGGVAVEPGDFVVADRSGVVFVPHARAAEIVLAAEDIYAREAAMALALREGHTLARALGSYETLLGRAPVPAESAGEKTT